MFEKCVGNAAFRYDLSTPFVRGGFRYATNGHIAVREQTSDDDTEPRDKPFAPCEKLPFGFVGGEWLTLPVLTRGQAEGLGMCLACEGTGERQIDGRPMACMDCDGDGNDDDCFRVHFGNGKLMAARYADLIRRAGIEQVNVMPKGRGFMFAGGVGNIEVVVMGCEPHCLNGCPMCRWRHVDAAAHAR